MAIANDVRNQPEFKDVFLADPQILGVDSVKGSQLIFPVVFKTKATKQYAPMREFQRRVRLALEENHMLPGDPMRVFNSFDGTGGSTASVVHEESAPAKAPDPTTLKPQEVHPLTGEG
jgi:small conductance mechanosensitive channel